MPTPGPVRFANFVGWFAITLIAAMLAPSWPYAAFALVVGVVALRWGLKFDLRASERRRLIADCDCQHAEVMAGQIVIPGPVWTDDTPIDPQWTISTSAGRFTLEGRR